MKHVIPFLTVLLLIGACDSNSPSNTEKFSALNDTTYTFIVDRTGDLSSVQFPTDELTDENYSTFNGDKSYAISFSEDGESVSIEPGSIGGKKISETNKLEFNLTEGLFAGGRFVVWIENNQFEAELTVYGSGVPMISSEQGKLIP